MSHFEPGAALFVDGVSPVVEGLGEGASDDKPLNGKLCLGCGGCEGCAYACVRARAKCAPYVYLSAPLLEGHPSTPSTPSTTLAASRKERKSYVDGLGEGGEAPSTWRSRGLTRCSKGSSATRARVLPGLSLCGYAEARAFSRARVSRITSRRRGFQPVSRISDGVKACLSLIAWRIAPDRHVVAIGSARATGTIAAWRIPT